MLIKIGSTKLYNAINLEDWLDVDLDDWQTEDLEPWLELEYFYKMNSFLIQHAIEERSTASFRAKDETSQWTFLHGQPVTIIDLAGILHFAGIIDTDEEEMLGGTSPFKWHQVSCADMHFHIDKRAVFATWENKEVGRQVYDLLYIFFKNEGIREGQIVFGDNVPQAIANYIYGNEALDARVEWTGDYTWFVDYYGKLFFIPRTSYTCPWELTPADIIGQPTVKNSAPKYRNVQYVTGSSEETDLQTEHKKGDGINRTFTFAYPITKEPTIYVNDVEDTSVGILGVETGKHWYWSKGSYNISQDSSQGVLISTDDLKVEYVGIYPFVVMSVDTAAMGLEQSTEGQGTGMVEAVENNPNFDSKEAAQDRSDALISHFAYKGKTLVYRTLRDDGIAAGQLQPINLSAHGIDAVNYLIISIEVREENALLYRDVVACEGPVEDGWEKTFCRMAAGARQNQIYQNAASGSSIIGLYTFTKNWLESEDPNIFKAIYPGATTCETAGWPCIAAEDKQKYIVLASKSGTQYLRKYYASQDQGAEEIDTTFYITPGEIIGETVKKVQLWGGNLATEEEGTGIKLSEWSWSKIKTAYEAWQILTRDIKW